MRCVTRSIEVIEAPGIWWLPGFTMRFINVEDSEYMMSGDNGAKSFQAVYQKPRR